MQYAQGKSAFCQAVTHLDLHYRLRRTAWYPVARTSSRTLQSTLPLWVPVAFCVIPGLKLESTLNCSHHFVCLLPESIPLTDLDIVLHSHISLRHKNIIAKAIYLVRCLTARLSISIHAA